jgi:hypothetical protein
MRVLSVRRAVALTAVILGVGAVSALAAASLTYKGRTSQHRSVTVTVSGRMITNLVIGWDARCPGGVVGPLKTYHHFVPLDKRGRWQVAGHYSAASGNGLTEHFRVADHGAFTAGGRGQGVFTAKVRVYRHSRYLYGCASGRITFRFKRTR